MNLTGFLCLIDGKRLPVACGILFKKTINPITIDETGILRVTHVCMKVDSLCKSHKHLTCVLLLHCDQWTPLLKEQKRGWI